MNMYAQTKVLPHQKGKFEKQDCGLLWLYWNSLKSTAGAQRVNSQKVSKPKNQQNMNILGLKDLRFPAKRGISSDSSMQDIKVRVSPQVTVPSVGNILQLVFFCFFVIL